MAIRISGNHFVNQNGQVIRMLGIDRSAWVYACIQGWAVVDGPANDAEVVAMSTWHINAVRLQLNEDCWLGINGVNPSYGGANYRNAVINYVNLLHRHGMYAVLSLAWNAPGGGQATGQQVMADADHAPAFWTSVASTFKNDPAVVFDLYNEPHNISWSCWRDGTGCPSGGPWTGMQQLMNSVRATGAVQPVVLGGLGYANDLSQWLQYRPSDPAGQTGAAFHYYTNWSWPCGTPQCLISGANSVLPVVAQVPTLVGELGELDCTHAGIDAVMPVLDANGISYFGFTWEAWGAAACGSGPTMLADWNGTPNAYGIGFKNHLIAIN